MIRRPTPAEIADAAAITAYHAKLNSRADAAAKFVFAFVLGLLGALALLHFLTPCDAGTLCWAPVVIAGGAGARPAPPPDAPGRLSLLGHALAIACRRLQVRWLHVRLQQLELLARVQIHQVRRGRTVESLRYARVLCRQAEVRLHLKQAHAVIAEHVAARRAARPVPATPDIGEL